MQFIKTGSKLSLRLLMLALGHRQFGPEIGLYLSQCGRLLRRRTAASQSESCDDSADQSGDGNDDDDRAVHKMRGVSVAGF